MTGSCSKAGARPRDDSDRPAWSSSVTSAPEETAFTSTGYHHAGCHFTVTGPSGVMVAAPIHRAFKSPDRNCRTWTTIK